MSNLEKLVPPVDLCRQIPAGMFENSAMVWYRATISGDYVCLPRLYKNVDAARTVAPAPTLAEIMEEIPCFIADNYLSGNVFTIVAPKDPKYRSDIRGAREEKPVIAALKLWLELNTETDKTDKTDRSDE